MLEPSAGAMAYGQHLLASLAMGPTAASRQVGCTLPHCFSLTTSGARLGELAAILTALTFTAIIFLARRDGEEDSLGGTQIMLFAAFVSLATASYLFSGVAAEEQEGPRTAFEAFCASLVLSISLQSLFLGITRLMLHHALGSATRFAAQVSNLFVGPTIFAFMSATAIGGVELYAPTSNAYQSVTAAVCIGSFIALLVWMFATFLIFRVRGLPSKIWPSAAAWAGGSLGIVAIASFLTLFWAEVSPDKAMPASVYLAFMALLLVATMGYSLQLTFVAETMRLRTSSVTKPRMFQRLRRKPAAGAERQAAEPEDATAAP